MTIETTFDVDNRFSWNQIDSIFDALGALDMRVTFYDSGLVKEEDYDNGLLIQKIVHDGDDTSAPNTFVWDFIETYFDPLGSVTSQVTFFDDGRLREDTFENDIRTLRIEHDNPQDSEGTGAKKWDRVETTYDANGQIENKLVIFDNGVVSDTVWSGGQRVSSVTLDNPQDSSGNGARFFERVESTYDANGERDSRTTFYDDGQVKEELWQDGIRTQTTQHDNPQDPGGTGAKSWSSIETNYDANGLKADKTTHYDDGRILSQTWVDGIQTHSIMQDNPGGQDGGAKAWDQVETFFDEFGEISERVTTYDSGSVREDVWLFGDRYSSITTDVGKTNDWIQSEVYYDAFGNRESRTTQYDDGRVTYQTYEAGVLTQEITEDAPFSFGDGSYDWSAQGTLYENGERILTGISYDTGDMEITEYQGDRISHLHERDGDFSEEWLGRTTTYNLDGSTTVELYYSEYDMPAVWDFDISQGQNDAII